MTSTCDEYLGEVMLSLAALDVTPGARLVGVAVAMRGDWDGPSRGRNARPSVRYLQERTGLNRTRVFAHLAALRAAGWLTVQEQRPGRPTVYAVAVIPTRPANRDGVEPGTRPANRDTPVPQTGTGTRPANRDATYPVPIKTAPPGPPTGPAPIPPAVAALFDAYRERHPTQPGLPGVDDLAGNRAERRRRPPRPSPRARAVLDPATYRRQEVAT